MVNFQSGSPAIYTGVGFLIESLPFFVNLLKQTFQTYHVRFNQVKYICNSNLRLLKVF